MSFGGFGFRVSGLGFGSKILPLFDDDKMWRMFSLPHLAGPLRSDICEAAVKAYGNRASAFGGKGRVM